MAIAIVMQGLCYAPVARHASTLDGNLSGSDSPIIWYTTSTICSRFGFEK